MIGFSGLCAPTPTQVRFMFHVWGDRPHLDMINGSWRCVGQHAYGYGATIPDAYRNWLVMGGSTL